MQQIDWSKAPDGTTAANQDEHWFYFYKDITESGCKVFEVNKNQQGPSSEIWQYMPGRPNPSTLFERPFKGVDKLRVMETMKKRPIDSWSAGDCAVLPSGWAWVAADGRHPHLDTLVRSFDGATVKFSDVYGMTSIFAPQPPIPSISLGYPPTLAPEAISAIATLERLLYTYHGGELWKPPLGKTPDHIEFDGWKVGDECWISNELGYGPVKGQESYVGSDRDSHVLVLFKHPNGYKMAVVEHDDGSCFCWVLNMLKRPMSNRDKGIDKIFKLVKAKLEDCEYVAKPHEIEIWKSLATNIYDSGELNER